MLCSDLPRHEYNAHVLSKSDPELKKAPNLKLIVDNINEASKQFGTEIDMGSKLKQLMIDAGFADVAEKIVHVGTRHTPQKYTKLTKTHRSQSAPGRKAKKPRRWESFIVNISATALIPLPLDSSREYWAGRLRIAIRVWRRRKRSCETHRISSTKSSSTCMPEDRRADSELVDPTSRPSQCRSRNQEGGV